MLTKHDFHGLIAGNKNKNYGRCHRCKIEGKIVNIAGKWVMAFFVNGCWTQERPECKQRG